MKKDNLYDEILQIGIKESKYNNNESRKERLKLAMQKRLRDFIMTKVKKTA